MTSAPRKITKFLAVFALSLIVSAEETVKCSKKLESWEDLTSMPDFGDAKSLVSKHLKPEVWESLKDEKD